MAAGPMRHRSIRTAFLGSLAGALLSVFLKVLLVVKPLTAFLTNQVIGHFLLLFGLSQ
jgi:xanthine/uracil permease